MIWLLLFLVGNLHFIDAHAIPINGNGKPKLIVDTDGLIDDVKALILALTYGDVIAITTSSACEGVNISQIDANVNRIRRLLNKTTVTLAEIPVKYSFIFHVPIYRGSSFPIVLPTHPRGCAQIIFGKDHLGERPDAEPVLQETDFTASDPTDSGASAIVRLTKEMPNQITLVCLGPLTNIALALKMDPDLGKRLYKFVTMGGSMWAIGNALPFTLWSVTHWQSTGEYNFMSDPEAARIVLTQMNRQILLVPWEMHLDVFLPFRGPTDAFDDVNDYMHFPTPISRFLLAITEFPRSVGIQNLHHMDEIAVAVALDPYIAVSTREVRATVEVSGMFTRGQMVIDWTGDMNDANITKNVMAVLHYNVKKVHDLLINAVNH